MNHSERSTAIRRSARRPDAANRGRSAAAKRATNGWPQAMLPQWTRYLAKSPIRLERNWTKRPRPDRGSPMHRPNAQPQANEQRRRSLGWCGFESGWQWNAFKTCRLAFRLTCFEFEVRYVQILSGRRPDLHSSPHRSLPLPEGEDLGLSAQSTYLISIFREIKRIRRL